MVRPFGALRECTERRCLSHCPHGEKPRDKTKEVLGPPLWWWCPNRVWKTHPDFEKAFEKRKRERKEEKKRSTPIAGLASPIFLGKRERDGPKVW
jgi:hypothetical protein